MVGLDAEWGGEKDGRNRRERRNAEGTDDMKEKGEWKGRRQDRHSANLVSVTSVSISPMGRHIQLAQLTWMAGYTSKMVYLQMVTRPQLGSLLHVCFTASTLLVE